MKSSVLWLVAVGLGACNMHRSGEGTSTASTAVETTNAAATAPAAATVTTTAATATPAPAVATTGSDRGDEASARALLMKFLAPNADRAALTKPLRPTKADYAALFDAPTAAKLQPQYDEHWDKEQMVIEPKAGQTELKLSSATSEDLQAGKGDFPGGWKKVAPHLTPHQTWYRFKFVKPGEDLGMAFDGLTFVNGHWVITPKPWHGL